MENTQYERYQRGGGGHQLIGGTIEVQTHLVAVQVARHMPELHADLSMAAVQRLTGLQKEGHPVPPRIVDEHGHRCKCWAYAAGSQAPHILQTLSLS